MLQSLDIMLDDDAEEGFDDVVDDFRLVDVVSSYESTDGGVRLCSNDKSVCTWIDDGACDDGGLGSSYSECDLGTDCNDCGERIVTPSPTPAPTPPTAAPTAAPTIYLDPQDC